MPLSNSSNSPTCSRLRGFSPAAELCEAFGLRQPSAALASNSHDAAEVSSRRESFGQFESDRGLPQSKSFAKFESVFICVYRWLKWLFVLTLLVSKGFCGEQGLRESSG